eukprot:7172836-Alexandrium_andersonii.AAC.1
MVLQRLQLFEAEPARYRKAWLPAYPKVVGSKRMWACVAGPVSGCIATLLGLGWGLSGPTDWASPCEARFVYARGSEVSRRTCADLL